MKPLKKVVIHQSQKQKVISQECLLANTAISRLVGLLNHQKLQQGEALLLDPCNQVHTFFMKFPIDAVFLNRENEIIAISELRPWRISKLYFKASRVLELPLGTSREFELKIGEKLLVTPC
jgi:uncharacterized membrane protein (UPF0127 family)